MNEPLNIQCPTGNCGTKCMLTGCSLKHVAALVFAALVVTVLYNWGFNGVYMMPDYQATSDVWRTEADMQSVSHYFIYYDILIALAAGGLYAMVAQWSPCRGACPKKGLRFGLLIGILFGTVMAGNYIWLPIPMILGIKWFVGYVIWGLLTGFVLSRVCALCNKSKTI